jgi:hypothetical protein|tara:strand:- start:9 stop:305 length:297 start_codon:yes stop_codon:yes gene_type:complete
MVKTINVTGALTQELLAAGDNKVVSSVWLTNIHASDAVTVDLYIEKKLTGKFYFLKSFSIANANYLFLEKMAFNNRADQFGLFIKLNASDSAVDVIIR